MEIDPDATLNQDILDLQPLMNQVKQTNPQSAARMIGGSRATRVAANPQEEQQGKRRKRNADAGS